MRIAVISDIHANFTAFQSVLDDIATQSVTDIISLGDNIGYGPEPDRVTAKIRQLNITSIIGNHEYASANLRYRQRINPSARESLELNIAKLSQDDLDYLGVLPKVIIRHGARFVHGSPPKSVFAYLYNPRYRMIEYLFNAIEQKICFYGHTHALDMFSYDGSRCRRKKIRPGSYQLDPKKHYFINPGSVGQPRDMINNQAKYLIWDQDAGSIECRSIPYDVKDTVAKIKEMGLPQANWQRLL